MAKKKTVLGQALAALGSSTEEDIKAGDEKDYHIGPAKKRGREILDSMAGTMSTITTLEVQPGQCKMWNLHNRIYNLLDEQYCADLIESFKVQNQIHPAIVRKCKDDDHYDYEVICGARRHWTSTFLKRKFLIEVRELSDEDAFLLSNADNKDSKDISEYERAVEYKGALVRYYNNNQGMMAARLGMHGVTLSLYLALAELDKDIVAAYPDPREIKIHHAGKIRSLFKRPSNKTRLIKKAQELKNNTQHGDALEGVKIFKKLLSVLNDNSKVQPSQPVSSSKTGKKMMTLKQGKTGQINIKIEQKSGATKTEIVNTIKEYLEDNYQVS